MDETILTRHPDNNRNGVQLTRNKYNLVRDAMLRVLSANQDMTLRELTREVDHQLWGRFNASIPWYVKTIKLDLQARHVIEEVQVRHSRRLRLVR